VNSQADEFDCRFIVSPQFGGDVGRRIDPISASISAYAAIAFLSKWLAISFVAISGD
jgi:hypothetical protein